MVTVIIPTYKRAENIEKAINSILNQTYKDFEIIVVDDNDSDTKYRLDMIKTMQQYKDNKKIKYIKHEKNKNGAAARNTGIMEAKGEYVTFLDDDDYFMPDRLKILVNTLEKEKEYNGAYTATVLVKNGKIVGGSNARKSGNLKEELLLNTFSFGTGSNMFFRTEELKKINGFDEKFLRHQDIECMIRFLRENKIKGIDKVLVIKGQNDRSNEPNLDKYIKIKQIYIESFKQDILKLEKEKQNIFYKINIEALITLAIKNRRYKEVKRLKRELKKYTIKKQQFLNKTKIKNVINFINNYVPIRFIEEIVRRIIFNRKIDGETKKFIRKIYKEELY